MRLDFLLGFMAEALVILIAAKLVRDRICGLRGYQVNEMIVQKGSVAAATTQAGYLVGVLLGFLGTISGKGADAAFLGVAGEIAVAGLTAIVLLTLADLLGDRLIFRGAPGPGGALEGANLALALGKAAVSVATGLVLRGAMSDPEASLLARIAWFAAAQAVMVVAVLIYCRLTPYDDLGEIGRNNLAAGFPIAGILLAVGFVMEAAVAGRSADSTQGAALQVAKFLGFSLVLVYAFRLITDFVMLPRVKLSRAIVEEKNVAAGLQEGVSFLLASLIVTFFLG
jgi:uncharacterized membrane protein YjfL (UPF0719 family)